MVIPHEKLKPDILDSLIEEFVARQSAEQTHWDTSMPVIVAQVMGQLKSGKAVIIFNEEDGTCSIVPKDAEKLK